MHGGDCGVGDVRGGGVRLLEVQEEAIFFFGSTNIIPPYLR